MTDELAEALGSLRDPLTPYAPLLSRYQVQAIIRAAAVAALMGDGDQFLLTSINNLNEKRATLFEAIKHGDAEHQRWLNTAILDHFSGRVVQRPATPTSDPVEDRRVVLEYMISAFGKDRAEWILRHLLVFRPDIREALGRLLGERK